MARRCMLHVKAYFVTLRRCRSLLVTSLHVMALV